jgi:ferritin
VIIDDRSYDLIGQTSLRCRSGILIESVAMTAERFIKQLNIQIGNEFAAHQQYVACAVYYDSLTMPQLAAFFYRQALEERDHAMMMAQYLIDSDAEVEIPPVDAPQCRFASVIEPVELALAQERRVTEQIFELMSIARHDGDFASEQFTQWFIKEQVEETATMSDLLTVVRRAPSNIEAIEDYVLREQAAGGGTDSTAPRIAGA